MENTIRCPWCGTDPLYVSYHDSEWGIAVHDDAKLFEFLTLEGAQAGLSWITVLRKRENYRKLFHDWDILKIAAMTDHELEAILLDAGIVRNRLKIYSVRKNAKVAIEIQKEFGSLESYFWNESWIYHREERRDPENKKRIQHNDRIASQARNDRVFKSFPIINSPKSLSEIHAETGISKALSKDLKKRGMTFVGSTTIYAFMQAVGMVDDHLTSCFRKQTL